MAGKNILSLPEPVQDDEPATKKYVDDLQIHSIDKRGNIKFNRNINVSNQRIFSLKDPKKPYEAANKKYVDDSINKRIEEEKDNFLPQDPATKQYVDEAIKGLAGGDVLVSREGVFIKANGHYRATAPLDIDNQKMENLPDPVDGKDAVNKKYIDGIVENLTLKQGLVRENGGFNLVDSYINMNFNNIRNVGYPKHTEDAVPRSYVEDMADSIKEKVEKRTHIIAVSTNYQGELKKGEYQFSFGGVASKNTGFLIPHSGRIKKVKFAIGYIPTLLGSIIFPGVFYNDNLFSIMLFRQIKKNDGGENIEVFNAEKEKEFEYVKKYIDEEKLLTTYRCKLRRKEGQVCFKSLDNLKDYPLLKDDLINIKTEIDYKFPDAHFTPEELGDNEYKGKQFSFLVTFVIELDEIDSIESENEEEDD